MPSAKRNWFEASAVQVLSVSILTLACIPGIISLDYVDLETLGINCPSLISCSFIGNSNFTRRNCECDRQCVLYNDCCVDARTRVISRNRRSAPFVCLPFGSLPNMGVYVINTCSRNFAGSAELQRKCQNRNNISDPVMAAPVTDTSTRVTYQNRYCAECNDVPVENLKSWLIQLDCDWTSTVNVSDNYIWENINYRASFNKWGVDINRRFRTCDLVFDKPGYLDNSVRLCRADAISSCPRTYTRLTIKRECESYTAVMYSGNNMVYRNPHCALCNGLTVDTISCDTGISPRKKKPFSFALLLDVNRSDGDVVGVSRPGGETCKENQKYDPYFKKCRDLVCALPGYKIVNGKCKKPE